MYLLEMLDDKTLIVIQTIFEIVIACIFYFTLPIYNKKYLNVFKYGFFCRSLGFLLIVMRGEIPLWLSVIVGNTVLQIGFFIIVYGLLMMLGVSIRKRYLVALNILHFILFLYYTFVQPNISMRIVIYSTTQIIPVLYLLSVYSKSILKVRNLIKGGIVALYMGMIVANGLRIYQGLFYDQITELFRNDWVLKVTLLYSLLFSFLRVYMIFLFVAQEYQEELIEANMKLETLSYKDNLTQINNNRAIMNSLRDEVERSQRYGHSVSIAMLDIDDFKSINDTHGHMFGDVVLKRLATIFFNSIRNCDAVGRYGGEEFLIIMPETTAMEAEQLIHRIKMQVNEVLWEEACGLKVSFSAGIYEVAKYDKVESVRYLIDKADKLMYIAKKKGKDRIEIG